MSSLRVPALKPQKSFSTVHKACPARGNPACAALGIDVRNYYSAHLLCRFLRKEAAAPEVDRACRALAHLTKRLFFATDITTLTPSPNWHKMAVQSRKISSTVAAEQKADSTQRLLKRGVKSQLLSWDEIPAWYQ